LDTDLDKVGFILFAERMEEDPIGYLTRIWSSMNAMEMEKLNEFIQRRIAYHDHISDGMFSNKYDKGCPLCKDAKKLRKICKKEKIKIGSKESNELINKNLNERTKHTIEFPKPKKRKKK